MKSRLSHLEVDLYFVFDALLHHKRVLLEALQVSWKTKVKVYNTACGGDTVHQVAQLARLSLSAAAQSDHQGRELRKWLINPLTHESCHY